MSQQQPQQQQDKGGGGRGKSTQFKPHKEGTVGGGGGRGVGRGTGASKASEASNAMLVDTKDGDNNNIETLQSFWSLIQVSEHLYAPRVLLLSSLVLRQPLTTPHP